MTEATASSFTIAQAAALCGLEPSMVDYLCRHRIIVPSCAGQRGRGRPRLYLFGDVVMLRVVARLLRAGISVARLREGLEVLRQHHPEITPGSLPAKYLVTDGRQVFFWTGKSSLEALDTTGQFSFAFIVELEGVRSEILQSLRKLAG